MPKLTTRKPTKPSQLADVAGPVVVDTEGSGTYPDDGARVSTVSLRWREQTGRAVAVAFPFDQGRQRKVAQASLLEMDAEYNLPISEWDALLDWLAGRDLLVFHNAPHDLAQLRAGTTNGWDGVDLLRAGVDFWDTMLVQRELDPRDKVGLEATAERYGLGHKSDAVKVWLKKNRHPAHRYDLVPWEVMEPYATGDAEITGDLYDLQLERIEAGESSLAVIRHEHRVMRALIEIERRGMGFDVQECERSAEILRGVLAEMAKDLPFKPPTIVQAKRYWFKEKGYLPYETTAIKKEARLDDDILRRMVSDQVPFAAEYAKYRKIESALSKWYEGYPKMIGPDGRLRCRFRQTKVVSGRFSVERVQLHAIPHDYKLAELPDEITPVRAMFRPKEGYRLWEMDLEQAELRVAAKLARCESMLQLIKSGADAHGETARQLFDVEPGHPGWTESRQVAKRANFSLIFGIGAAGFQAALWKYLSVKKTEPQCESIIRRWRNLYPEFGRAIRRATEVGKRRGYVKLVNGRPSWFAEHERKDDRKMHKAFNRIVQASLAELNKLWLVEVEDLTKQWDGLVMTTHDSLDLELPDEDWAEGVVAQCAEIGGKLGTEMFDVPMAVEYKEWGA